MKTIRKNFDERARVLYISVGNPRPAISRHLPDGILIRVDVHTGEFLGLTVFDFSTAKEKKYESTLKGSSTIPDKLLPHLINELRNVSPGSRKKAPQHTLS